MSYKALYRKYRPKSFNEVIGQDHIVTTLKNIIESKKVSHAYLFSGPRGTGKTSVAYIFANEINKTAAGNITKNDFDIIEIDAASNNGVAEIRNLIDNSHYTPANSKYKVYIIDEVHMLTKGAFNALLKTLEEPPKHLVFILATTEPHKIPTTILSRAQHFNFRRIDDKLMIEKLKSVLDNEGIEYENEAIKFAARLAQGGMRDSLSIVDQAASYSNNKISFVAISQVFGLISLENQIKILNFVYEGKTKDFLINIENFINNGADIERLINSLVDIVKDFIIYKKTSDIELCSILSKEDLNIISISIPFAYEAMSELIETIKYIKFSEMKKQVFEICLLKLSSFNKEENNKQLEIESEIKKEDHKKEEINQKEETSKDANDIFETQENVVESDTNDNDLLNESDTIDKKLLNTDEIQMTQDTILEQEQTKMVNQNIDEQITSTQDIPINELNDASEEATEEVNLSSYFNFEEKTQKKDEINNSKQVFNLNELINYLQHANKDKITKFKKAFPNVINLIDNVEDKSYITLIQKSIFISGGEKFIIISSKDEDITNSLKGEANKQAFIDLIGLLLGEAVNIVVISKKEFNELKNEWDNLSKSGKLPPKRPIKDVKLTKKPKSNIEEYGEDLFGDLFK